MDIELSDGTVFELLDKLLTVDFGIIFTTAHDKYSLKAIRYSALDYLLKPVDTDELTAAFQKAKERVSQLSLNERLYNLLGNIGKNMHRIALPVKEGFDFVNVEDIIRCEALNNYTSVFISSGKKYVCARTAKEFEELLPGQLFFRVHHAHIVNINFVKKYHKSGRGGYVELTDGTTVEVAYRRKEEFLSKFGYR
jgi:two-component system, LytTR family, response regulator